MAGFVKILLVDDSAAVRGVLSCMLNTRGFQVITAEDGELGLKMAEAERPDLIITDIEMPRLDGIQMIARLREQPELREVPILVISGNDEGKTTEAIQAGASLAMHKPVDLNFFISQVNQLLSARSV